MNYLLWIACLAVLVATTEWCRETDEDEIAKVVDHPWYSERVTGLFTSRMILVSDDEVWVPRARRDDALIDRIAKSMTVCEYCDTEGSWSKKNHCRECGAPRLT